MLAFFKQRQDCLVLYNNITVKTVIAIVILHSIYLISFLVLYFNGYEDFKNVFFVPISAIFISVLLWVLLKKIPITRTSVIMIWAHFLCCYVACVGVHFFGWNYGFYMLLIMAIGLNYIHNFNSGVISVILSFCELMIFIILLLYHRDETPKIIASKDIERFFYLFNFLFISSSILFYASLTKISNAITIKNLTEQKKLIEQKARKDFLTDLFNRKTGEEQLKKLLDQISLQRKHSLVFCLGDLDNFKKINDTYGHNFGDKILREMAMVMKSSFKGVDDMCVRWGGEEFVILMSDVSLNASYKQVETLRQNIQNYKIKLGDSDISVTISFGFVYVENACDIEDIFSRADELMYKAKTSGKNKTVYDVL